MSDHEERQERAKRRAEMIANGMDEIIATGAHTDSDLAMILAGVKLSHKHADEIVDLLCAANMIATRAGKNTNWGAFQESVLKALAPYNRNGNTARTYRIVRDDQESN
jgi:selenocysteine lyase/cysteine desulfurase